MRWDVRAVALGVVLVAMSGVSPARAERLATGHPLTQELVALYRRSEEALKRKDHVAYFATLSQPRVQRFEGMVKAGKVASKEALMEKLVSMSPATSPQPLFAQRNGTEAVLVMIAPGGGSDSLPPGKPADDGIVREIFVQESGGWRWDHQEGTDKPSWMSVETFLLSQEPTVFTPPARWTVTVQDKTGEQTTPFNDLVSFGLANDRQFLYLHAQFAGVPTFTSTTMPQLAVYFDTDKNASTGSTLDTVGPGISGWERKLSLGASLAGKPEAPWVYEVVPGVLPTPRTIVPFEQYLGWIHAGGTALDFKVPLELLGIQPGSAINFIVVDSQFEPLTSVARGSYSVSAE